MNVNIELDLTVLESALTALINDYRRITGVADRRAQWVASHRDTLKPEVVSWEEAEIARTRRDAARCRSQADYLDERLSYYRADRRCYFSTNVVMPELPFEVKK